MTRWDEDFYEGIDPPPTEEEKRQADRIIGVALILFMVFILGCLTLAMVRTPREAKPWCEPPPDLVEQAR